MKEKDGTVRVNTRISKELNEWLDAESMRTGIPKGSLMFIATENVMREKIVMQRMGEMGELVQRLESIENAIKKIEQ